jgi:hypothetical protein
LNPPSAEKVLQPESMPPAAIAARVIQVVMSCRGRCAHCMSGRIIHADTGS